MLNLRPDREIIILPTTPRTIEAYVSETYRLRVPVDPDETVEDLRDRIEKTFTEELGFSIGIRALMDCNLNELPFEAKIGVMLCDEDVVHVLLDATAKTEWFSMPSSPRTVSSSEGRITEGFRRVFSALEAMGGEHTVQGMLMERERLQRFGADFPRYKWARTKRLAQLLVDTALHMDVMSNGGSFGPEMQETLQGLEDYLILLPDVGRELVRVLESDPLSPSPLEQLQKRHDELQRGKELKKNPDLAQYCSKAEKSSGLAEAVAEDREKRTMGSKDPLPERKGNIREKLQDLGERIEQWEEDVRTSSDTGNRFSSYWRQSLRSTPDFNPDRREGLLARLERKHQLQRDIASDNLDRISGISDWTPQVSISRYRERSMMVGHKRGREEAASVVSRGVSFGHPLRARQRRPMGKSDGRGFPQLLPALDKSSTSERKVTGYDSQMRVEHNKGATEHVRDPRKELRLSREAPEDGSFDCSNSKNLHGQEGTGQTGEEREIGGGHDAAFKSNWKLSDGGEERKGAGPNSTNQHALVSGKTFQNRTSEFPSPMKKQKLVDGGNGPRRGLCEVA